ncbi:MAG: hypothetical protein KAR85_08190 [Methanosarcinales archaeon]|nr:hypothetical protein [Methanosarcinales archaeon]
MSENLHGSIEDIIERSRDIVSIEMGCDYVHLYCTTGKIKLWFGRLTSRYVVATVLQSLAKIDSSFNHEREIICDYDRIPVYENHDYTLMSYGKTDDGYRAQFNIQFSKQYALNHFIESIAKELINGDIDKTIHWNGSIDRIILIGKELESIDSWKISKVEYGMKHDTKKKIFEKG